MTEGEEMNPERIWLQPECCVSPMEGRQWCQDNVWPTDSDCDATGVEYVRADLARTPTATPSDEGWRPIETAPKRIPKPGDNIFAPRPDVLLGWRGSDTVLVGYWEPGRDEDGSWNQDGTRGAWASAAGYIAFTPPTHWMPLPEPPSQQ